MTKSLVATLVCIITAMSQPVYGQTGPKTIFVFMLDTSRSMKQGTGLPFNRVQRFLDQKVERSEIGDRIVIFTYDEVIREEADREILSAEDKVYLRKQIAGLSPKGQWTWMSESLRVLRQKMRDLHLAYRQKKIEAYFLTDGKNDPPPARGEPPRRFVDLLSSAFQDFRLEDAFVYVLYSDPAAINEEDAARIRRNGGILSKEIPRDDRVPIARQLKIVPELLQVSGSDPGATKVACQVQVEKLAEETAIPLYWSHDPAPLVSNGASRLPGELSIDPISALISKERQEVRFTVSWQEPVKPGQYYVELIPTVPNDVTLLTPKLGIQITVPSPPKPQARDVKVTPAELVLGRVEPGARSAKGRLILEQSQSGPPAEGSLKWIPTSPQTPKEKIWPGNATIEPSTFRLGMSRQELDFWVKCEKPLMPGNYVGEIGLESEENIRLTPDRIRVLLSVAKDTGKRIDLGLSEIRRSAAGDPDSRGLKLRIVKVQGVEGTPMQVQVMEPGFQITPATIPCTQGSYDLILSAPLGLKPGTHEVRFQFQHADPEVAIYPDEGRIGRKLQVGGKGSLGLSSLLPVIILLGIAGLLAYFALLRKREIWVRRMDSAQKTIALEVCGWGKSPLGELGLSDYFLMLQRFRNDVLLNKGHETVKQVQNGDRVTCHPRQGEVVDIVLRFEPFAQSTTGEGK